MSDAEIPSAETVVGQHWPLNGPYSDDQTRAAGATLSELVRYLNYATGQQGAVDGLPWAGSIESVVSSFGATVARMDQTLSQLCGRLRVFEQDPGLYDYTTSDHASAVRHAQEAAAGLSVAQQYARSLRAQLSAVCGSLNYLGHDD